MPQTRRRLFAVIPAAGRSRRMGRPKLLLPLGTTTIIGRLLETLTAAEIEAFVLVRPDDEALRAEAAGCGAVVVQPDDPPAEMRISVEHLLRAIDEQRNPRSDDGWLLIPGDHPLLSPATLQKLTAIWMKSPTQIVLPTFNARRGHPTLFPWSLAAAVQELPADVGINHLVRRHPQMVSEVTVDDPTVVLDIDTPADYEHAQRLFGE
jgi:molybdenum cofactor cytidylyltransferase